MSKLTPTYPVDLNSFLVNGPTGRVQHIPRYPNSTGGLGSRKTLCNVYGIWQMRQGDMEYCSKCIKRMPSAKET